MMTKSMGDKCSRLVELVPAAANMGVGLIINGLLMDLQILEGVAGVKFFVSGIASIEGDLLKRPSFSDRTKQ